MAERKLPVIYGIVTRERMPDGTIADFLAGACISAQSANEMATRRNGRIVEYVPREAIKPKRPLESSDRFSMAKRPLQCRECASMIDNDDYPGGKRCDNPRGLMIIEQDGTSSCSYAEPRESEE